MVLHFWLISLVFQFPYFIKINFPFSHQLVSFHFQHQAVEPGHNGELGVLAAILVGEDHKSARAPAAQHHKAAWAAAPRHSFVGLWGVQVIAIAISPFKPRFLLPKSRVTFSDANFYLHMLSFI